MTWNPAAAAAVTFGLVLAIVAGAYWALVLRAEIRDARDLRRRLVVRPGDPAMGAQSVLGATPRLSAIGALNALLARAEALTRPLQQRIAQAGLRLTVGVIVLASALLFSLAYVAVFSLTDRALAALAAAGVAAWLPMGYLNFVWHRHVRRLEDQFPEAIELIARALRAGHALTTGLRLAGEELPDPMAREFRLLHDRHNYGLPLPDAMREFAMRIPIVDARFFVTAVLTQRETGGNLAEVLDRLAGVMRERLRVRREVRVKSAHGRLSGFVIAAMPPALALALWLLRPERMEALVTDPVGLRMLLVALMLQLAGVAVIRRIVNVEY